MLASLVARQMDNVRGQIRSQAVSKRGLWLGRLCLAIAVGVAYFFAAQMSLALLTKPDGVAVFWPAAGISSGSLIALGSIARLPVTFGVLTASTIASLLGDRSPPPPTTFPLSNALEPPSPACLI